MIVLIPLTINSAVKWADVALFVATQLKFPMCRSVTESIVNTELRLPILAVVMPDISLTGLPLNSHRNSIGRSPEVTKHCTLAESPKFDGSSPNSNGANFGGTADKYVSLEIKREVRQSWK